MQDVNTEKEGIPQKLFIGIGLVAIVVVIGLVVYFFRASDPAARGPVPYQKFDYGAHMEQQKREMNRRTPTDPASMR